MGKPINPGFEQALEQMRPQLEIAYNLGTAHGRAQGFQEGFDLGMQLGTVQGLNALTPAVSDGLRHGSSVCGKALQSLKKLGVLDPDRGTDA